MKVEIDKLDHRGWYYFTTVTSPDTTEGRRIDMRSAPFPTYPAARDAAAGAGREVDNAGWRRKMLMWQFNSHALDGWPTWEVYAGGVRVTAGVHERGATPARARLGHVSGTGEGSTDLARAWDDVAATDFYTRDLSLDGSVFVSPGGRYDSAWSFATLAERDRFLAWLRERGGAEVVEVTP